MLSYVLVARQIYILTWTVIVTMIVIFKKVKIYVKEQWPLHFLRLLKEMFYKA